MKFKCGDKVYLKTIEELKEEGLVFCGYDSVFMFYPADSQNNKDRGHYTYNIYNLHTQGKTGVVEDFQPNTGLVTVKLDGKEQFVCTSYYTLMKLEDKPSYEGGAEEKIIEDVLRSCFTNDEAKETFNTYLDLLKRRVFERGYEAGRKRGAK